MTRSVLLLTTAMGVLLAASAASAKTRPGDDERVTARPGSGSTAPADNTAEWKLINLTPTIVADAHAGAGVVVGVYDGLADCNHPELAGRCSNTTMPGARYRWYNNHGTHVSGTVAGTKHGVAPSARIDNYAVFDDRRYVAGGTYLIDSWRSAAAKGASVASMSFGCTGLALCFSTEEVLAMGGSDLSGTLFVKAAGNDNVDLANESVAVSSAAALAALDRLILVGSTGVTGNISSFSNRPGEGCLLASGQALCTADTKWKYRFISAPGENIYAALPGGSFGYMSGTSMATPIVSGVVALLQAKWPVLKSDPTGTANILFNSATDIGAAGVDAVYGWGLLNVGEAFANSGDTTVIRADDGGAVSTLSVDSRSMSASSVMGLERVLSGVTAWDEYGRDYKLGEVSNFEIRRAVLSQLIGTGSRIANLGGHSDWTGAFFSRPKAQAWAGFGPQGATLNSGFGFDRSVRAGVDMPLNGGSLGLRLTGDSGTRADFASDATLAPLSFFASSDLLGRSAMVSFSQASSKNSRLVAFGALSGGTKLEPEMRQAFDDRTGFYEANREHGFDFERSPREQAAIGLGFWTRSDERTVVGFTASAVVQRHALYDLSSDLDAFDKPARLFNVGAAASRTYGKWDLFGALEATMVDAPEGAGPIQFTDAVLASGEAGVRRAGVLFGGKDTRDSLSLSVALAPSAVSGALELRYLERTPDGLGRQAVSRDVGLAELTGRTFRVQSAYTIQRERLSFGLATGADLAEEPGVSVASQLRWAF